MFKTLGRLVNCEMTSKGRFSNEHIQRQEVQGYSLPDRQTCRVCRRYRVIRYQIDILAECVGGTETTRNHIGMQSRKCRSCELWCKEAEKKATETATH
ncbi:hypothetical protein TNCV_5078041 [Trichonephila clavipes]|uniref:Uncharacterized protein n=1 Tax=Trichonephila clavipes TaxID=2585209 RepID=A0A8X6S6F8_TRICX|nr:hypothetical protein TNCV_5078041 [Trichonephila clavipes]